MVEESSPEDAEPTEPTVEPPVAEADYEETEIAVPTMAQIRIR